MKLFATATLATTLAFTGSVVFAQASGSMSHDSMAKDSMSKNSMSKNGMAHESMKKGDKMKKHDAMTHPASGAISQ